MEGSNNEILHNPSIDINNSDKLNHSILSSPSLESSYDRSPPINGPKPLLLASSTNKRIKDEESYTMPLLNDHRQIQTTKYMQRYRVIHRSLILHNNEIDDLHENGQQSMNSSPLSRRFSADDKSKIKTYVVLHQPSHNYQFFNEHHKRSASLWGPNIIEKQQKNIRKIERLNFDKMENEIYKLMIIQCAVALLLFGAFANPSVCSIFPIYLDLVRTI